MTNCAGSNLMATAKCHVPEVGKTNWTNLPMIQVIGSDTRIKYQWTLIPATCADLNVEVANKIS